jgi:large subunit ribosomal protein L23
MTDILIKPIITEKSMNHAANGKYTFLVGLHTDKKNIKRVVEKLFTVHVVSVMTTIVKGKSLRAGVRRIEIKKRPFKKAIVEVKKGEKIPLFETQS